MSVPEVVATIIGSLGLLLGVLNYRHQRDTTHPRVIVRPRVYNMFRTDTGKVIAKNAAVMEICNVGQLPVIGSSIGFRPRWEWISKVILFLPKCLRTGPEKLLKGRVQASWSIIPKPEPVQGHTWQRELGPQHVAIMRFSLDDLPDTHRLGRAFASTVVGDTFKASRWDMRIFAAQRKAASPIEPHSRVPSGPDMETDSE